MTKWIALKDQMPSENIGVLITDGKHVTVAEYLPYKTSEGLNDWWTGHCFGGYEWEWDDIDIYNLTHWAYLPEPPK